jgi:hypothetical protein
MTKTPHPSKLAQSFPSPPGLIDKGVKMRKNTGRKVGGMQTPTELRSSRSEHQVEVHQEARGRIRKIRKQNILTSS